MIIILTTILHRTGKVHVVIVVVKKINKRHKNKTLKLINQTTI